MRCAIEATAGALRILLLGVLCAVTLPGSAGTLEGEALVEALRAGGYNLYFRHAATEWSQDDQVRDRDDLPSCDPSRMRQLSAEGREAARRVGEAMRRLAVPVGEVWASPYCRTVETAEAMAVGDVRTTDDVLNYKAPLGQAMLGMKPGQVARLEIGGKFHELRIDNVEKVI